MKGDKGDSKAFASIIWTFSSFVAIGLVLLFTRMFPNVSLSISIALLVCIDLGFIVAFILGIQSKNKSILVFSVICNSLFFVTLSGFIFLLLLANGISER